MPSTIEAMLIQLHGEAWLKDVQETSLCKLTSRAGKYGGLHPKDIAAYRALRLTSDQINEDLDRAIGYESR